MAQDEPDWAQLTHPPTDPAKVVSLAGLAAIAVGVLVLALDASHRGIHLDMTALGFGLILAGGILRR
jgi:hypothetical protein